MERQWQPPLAELIDKLTVDILKSRLLPPNGSLETEITAIQADIAILCQKRGLLLTTDILRCVIELAQANYRIWVCKDRMAECPDRYGEYLKLAHQVNGLRNQSRNGLLRLLKDKASEHTNTNTDGL